MRSLLDLPHASAAARFSSDFAPRFLLTVDTEEEFDWNAPFQCSGYGLDHVPSLRKFQQFCEGHGVAPVYLIDYPIATSPRACDILRPAVANGHAEIGVQLHPWVNPPFSEDVTQYNSFAGNLPPELEQEKFHLLHEAIVQNIGAKPLIYRAGRYGLGPHSADILRREGIAIDSSIRSRFDYSAHDGRDYRKYPVTPYWVDDSKALLELPLTTVFTGPLRRIGCQLHPMLWRVPRLRGALARLRMLDRVPLTPEGVSAAEAIRGIDAALQDRLPILVFSFHSPSLQAGHTPYVRNDDDLDGLYAWWREIFAHLQRRGIQPTTVSEIMNNVRR